MIMIKRLARSIRNNTLIGFVLVTPLVATIVIFNFLFRLATAWLPDSAFPHLRDIWDGYFLRFMTLFAVLIALFLTGLLTRNLLGRRVYNLGDKIFGRIPLVKRIYLSVRKISEALFTQRHTLFKEVVLVEYPRKGIYSMAFVTTIVADSIIGGVREAHPECGDWVNLFIATSPNPTSGLMIMVPRSEIIPLAITITDALTFIMSAATVQPGDQNHVPASLLDRINEWAEQQRRQKLPSEGPSA